MSFDQILDRADMFGTARPLSDRLVSIVFANPTSPVWTELQGNRSFLDARSGDAWDLFFAGLSGYAPDPRSHDATPIDHLMHRPRFPGYFNPELFNEVERAVETGHRMAVTADPSIGRGWRYLGGTTLVSFMVYGRQPDWASLRDVPLYGEDGERLSLTHIVEGLARWQEEVVDPRLAPGEFTPKGVGGDTGLLVAALGWSASAVASGVMGDAAFELLKGLM